MTTSDNRRRLRQAMTLAEKASLASGQNFWNTKAVPRLGVPSIMLTDGPHGLRKQGGAADHLGLNASLPATCFPPAATLANGWDVALLERVGAALGAEAAAEDVAVLLGPGLNIKRSPLAGRNFEYFSEDPLLSGRLAGALVRGIQSRGVAACVKHFAVNSQETHRMSIDEVVDTRALHELYLEGFRVAIAEGDPWTLMTSYNRVNGTYANEHRGLAHVLRDVWGFDGLVVTDWGGNVDRVAGLEAGNALEMPSTDGVTDAEIVRAVGSGRLDEAVLDARVDELLALVDRTTGLGDAPRPAAPAVDHDAHHELAVAAARRCAVLLRNERDALPLGPGSGRVAVVGDFAAKPRYQGAGSSLVVPTRLDAALDALRATDLDVIGYEPGFARRDKPSRRRHDRALRLARRADTVLLFLGLDESAESESVDRTHLRLARNQLALARDLVDLGKRVVVVLSGGAPVELPFAEHVDAILHAYLGGQGGGRAVADLLTGVANPAGRLAETYPLSGDDVPASATFGHTEATSEHRESVYLGYRWFDKVGAPVRYPFGHGLSYTTFAYTDLVAGPTSARLTVTNTGDRAGTETVQLYVEAPDAARGELRAPRALAGFATAHLEPGASATVEITYADHAFDVYDAAADRWRTAAGTYTVIAAASSRDVRLRAPLDVAGQAWTTPDADRLPHYLTGDVAGVTDAEFATLLGRTPPPARWDTGRPLTRDDIVAQTRGRGGFASLLHGLVLTVSAALMALGRPHAANNTRFVLSLPFRSVARMSGGRVDDAMLDGLLLMVNRRFLPGVARVVSAWYARRRSGRTTRKD